MLSYTHGQDVGGGEGIKHYRAACEVDSKLKRVSWTSIIHFYSLNHTSPATYACDSIFFFYALYLIQRTHLRLCNR